MINKKSIKTFCNERGRQVSAEFIEYIEETLKRRLAIVCKTHNGGSKRLTPELAIFCGIK